jgi:hypothetical protein
MVKIIGLFVINIEQTLVGTGLANGKILNKISYYKENSIESYFTLTTNNN